MAHFPFHKAAIEPAVYDLGLQQSHSKKELELKLEMESRSGIGAGSWKLLVELLISCCLCAQLGLASGLP